MAFNFNDYKSSIIDFEESIESILILQNDYLCIGFCNKDINIYHPKDFTLKINIKYDKDDKDENNNINDEENYFDCKLFLIELMSNKLLSLYNYSKLYIRQINYINYSYQTIQIIDNYNYFYLRKSIHFNHIYGIYNNKLSYIKNTTEIISVLKFEEEKIEFFYEIPKKNPEICIKSNLYNDSLIFFDCKKFKYIDTIDYIYLNRNHSMQIDYSPFYYFDKYNLLGVFVEHDLLSFIDMKTHKIIYKYKNGWTTSRSIIYNYKLNDEKYFIVENVRPCFGLFSIIYLSDLKPQNIDYDKFSNEITMLGGLEKINVKFACFSYSMKYLVLQIEDKKIRFYCLS